MPFDKNMNKISNFNYLVANKAVSEGRDEIVFEWEQQVYDIGICNNEIVKMWCTSSNININNLERYCYNKTKNKLIIVAESKNFLDKVFINGSSLKEIWDKIILL